MAKFLEAILPAIAYGALGGAAFYMLAAVVATISAAITPLQGFAVGFTGAFAVALHSELSK